MLAHLAQAAAAVGVDRLTASVLAGNGRMLEVFRRSGLSPVVRRGDGDLHLSMATWLGPEALAHYDARDAEAAVAAIRHVLRPASLAVVGASEPSRVHRRRRPDATSWPPGSRGTVHRVNPHRQTVGGLARRADGWRRWASRWSWR